MIPTPETSVWGQALNPNGLTELEVAAGVVFNSRSGSRGPVELSADPVDTLRDRARSLLATPPCVIAFSGGRDSSALLAVLIDEARRTGLPEPIPVTARWDDDLDSGEADWQEEVIRTVGSTQWEIIRPGTDLDLLGSEATTALERLGLMWPAPAYALLPMIRTASGGVFLTGEGGDEAFGLWPYARLWWWLRGGPLPRRGALQRLALACAPSIVRRRRTISNSPPYQTWLLPASFQRTAELTADEEANDSLWWNDYQRSIASRRSVVLGQRTMERLCETADTRFSAPFQEDAFLSSLARWGGRLGRGNRTSVMTGLFDSVLPGPILSRKSKATFGGVFWGPESRRFAEEWTGDGFLPGVVDAEALRRAWLEPTPVYGAALPLQAAWLGARDGKPVAKGPTP